MLTAGWGAPPAASLSGAALSPLPLGPGYELGELAPNTSYTVMLDLDDGRARFERTFTTGSGPGPVAPDAAPGAVRTDRLCPGLVDQVRRDVPRGQSLAVGMRRPELFLHSHALPCAALHGIDATGAVHEGEPTCVGTLGDLLGNEDSGCSLPATRRTGTGGSPFGTVVAALALAAFCRRRQA